MRYRPFVPCFSGEVIGSRHYSIDLPQGGLDIPCKLIFRSEAKLIVKVQNLLQEAVDSGLLALSSTSIRALLSIQ